LLLQHTVNKLSKLSQSCPNIILFVFVGHGMGFHVIRRPKEKLVGACWLSIIQYNRMSNCLEKCLP